jgi:hypothetical protein
MAVGNGRLPFLGSQVHFLGENPELRPAIFMRRFFTLPPGRQIRIIAPLCGDNIRFI